MDANQNTCLGRQSAIAEADALYRMIGDEHTVEAIRELIVVPPKIEAMLLAYAREFPEEAYIANRTLKFRASVLKEFERLVAEGVPIAEILEVEDADLDTSTKAVAFAQA